jgi:hypothetical protein
MGMIVREKGGLKRLRALAVCFRGQRLENGLPIGSRDQAEGQLGGHPFKLENVWLPAKDSSASLQLIDVCMMATADLSTLSTLEHTEHTRVRDM